MNSANDEVSLDGLPIADAKQRISEWLEASEHRRAPRSPTSCATGCSAASATGASRSRSSTTTTTCPVAVPESMLPVELPEMTDFEPRILADDDTVAARAAARARRRLGARRARPRRRRARVPARDEHDAAVGRFVLVLPALPRPDERERARRPRGRALLDGRRRLTAASTSTSAASSTRCCTCSTRASGTRCCSTSVTCRRPSRSTGSSTRARSPPPRSPTSAACTSRPTRSRSATARTSTTGDAGRRAHDGKMGKSLKNVVAPDDIYRDYGADTLRLYEMFMGPLDASRPWSTADIVGVHRFLQRFWRNVVDEDTGELARRRRRRPTTRPAALLHRTIDAVRRRHGRRSSSTPRSPRLFELNNRLTQVVAGAGERAARGRRRRWC